ncbi:MAG: hypothetical protein HC915_19835 [Anaerolineae bacterium]|nr:hypothetical protein [Anaerolineae bacterium]
MDSFTYQVVDSSGTPSNFATVSLMVNAGNQAPVCTNAAPAVELLWEAGGSLQPVTLVNISDPEGGSVSITFTGVMQDEPVSGTSVGDQAPDASGVGTGSLSVRAEVGVESNGRVYSISFQAVDALGASCTGTVQVGVVPLYSEDTPFNDGTIYDSSQP